VTALAAGLGHALALKADGSVAAWGSFPFANVNAPPPDLDRVKSIAVGDRHSLALKSDGNVVAWGDDTYHQIDVPPGLSNVVAIGGGWHSSVALKAGGTVVMWGSSLETNVPRGLSNVVAIAEGQQHVLALKIDGTVVAWGLNSYGQTNVPAGLADVVAIGAGANHSLAVKGDGTVVAWGQNAYGQTDVPSDLTDVVAVAGGTAHSLALRSDGSVVAWGAAQAGVNYGQTAVPAGLTEVRAIAAGYYYSLALVSKGSPLYIAQQPRSQIVALGSNAVFSVATSGAGPISYQWYANAQPLTNSAQISGANSATLQISDAQTTNAATYTVRVSNASVSILSDGAALAVVVPPTFTGAAVQAKVPAARNFGVTFTAQGTAPIFYQWEFNGAPIAGATSPTLVLTNVQAGAAGTYTLLATNLGGAAFSPPVVLSVEELLPRFVTNLSTNQLAPLFGFTTLSAAATGSAPISYQWRFNGLDLPGATNAALSLGPLTMAQSGYYNVIASNSAGQVSSGKTLLLVAQAVSGYDPAISSTNQAFLLHFTNLVAASLGSSAIVLKADGSVAGTSPYVPPLLTDVAAVSAPHAALRSNGFVVTWAMGMPTPIAGPSNIVAISDSYSGLTVLNSNGMVALSGQFATNVPADLTNVVAISTEFSKHLALRANGTVVEWSGATLLNTAPSGLTNVIAMALNGGAVALLANGAVVGWDGIAPNPLPGISNLVAVAASRGSVIGLTSDGRVLTDSASHISFPFPITNAFSIAGGMAVFAGEAIALLGDGAPRLTVQPGNQMIGPGGGVWLHARGVGVQPLQFQWTHNGIPIPSATNADLILTNVPENVVGDYQALISNRLGTVASRVARVSLPYTLSLAQALDGPNLSWTSSGNQPWFSEPFVTHDGQFAAQSGPIPDGGQSTLQTSVNGPGLLQFWWKVSSEQYFDLLEFFDNGTNVLSISGEVDWTQASIAIGAGVHQLRWVYSKDNEVSDGADAGWLDQVNFFVAPAPMLLGAPVVQAGGVVSFPAQTPDGLADPFAGPAGFAFEASSNLIEWTTLTNLPILSNGVVSVCDPDATNSPARFYRLKHR
jgi:hypothetical protein